MCCPPINASRKPTRPSTPAPVLTEPVEILGRPRLILRVDSDAEVINFAARLCDVAPDGSSALVTKGVLNATHRESHSDPSPLVPGEVVELTIDLDATSWLFEPGHRIRLSVSNADFPNAWPSPTLATSRLHLGGERPSRLILPVVPEPAEPIARARFRAVAVSHRGRARGGTAAVAGEA